MKREEVTEKILDEMREKNITFEQIAKTVGRHKVWVAAAIFGQASMTALEAGMIFSVLGLDRS